MPGPNRKKWAAFPQEHSIRSTSEIAVEEGHLSPSLRGEDSGASESLEVLQDDRVQEEEIRVVLGMLTRMGAQNQMWSNKFFGLNVIFCYVTTYTTYARFCYFLDRFGVSFVPIFFVCLLVVGLPLVYLEMALGQFTTMNAVLVFRRIAPIASGLGVSMLFLGLIVTVIDFSLIVTLLSVLGNSIQINSNEMAWHRCTNEGDGITCVPSSFTCPELHPEDFKGDGLLPKAADMSEGWIRRSSLVKYGGGCLSNDHYLAYFPSSSPKQFTEYSSISAISPRPALSYLLSRIGIDSGSDIPLFGFPSVDDILLWFVSWLLLLGLSMQGRNFFLKVCVVAIALFNSTMIIVLGVMLLAQEDAYLDIFLTDAYSIGVWAIAIQLTLYTLRIGQGGLFFLGSQNRFTNNLFIDAFAIVMYVFVSISLFTTVHVLFRATSAIRFQSSAWIRQTSQAIPYSQFFSYWDAAAHISAYHSYEPCLQFALSCVYLMTSLANIRLALEAIVANCINTLDILYDTVSSNTIKYVSTLFLVLFSLTLFSNAGFTMVVTIENSVIPPATASIVLLELLVFGIFYGFPRVCANVLSMSTQGEDSILRRIWTMFYLYLWYISPMMILVSLLYHTRGYRELVATVITMLILLPTLIIGTFKILQCLHKKRNLSMLFSPEHELWGPRMTDDRRRATKMEKKLQVRTSWLWRR